MLGGGYESGPSASPTSQADPASSHAITARNLHDRGECEKAIGEYDLAISLEPERNYQGGRGEVYLDLGQYQLALADFDEAIRLLQGSPISEFGVDFTRTTRTYRSITYSMLGLETLAKR